MSTALRDASKVAEILAFIDGAYVPGSGRRFENRSPVSQAA